MSTELTVQQKFEEKIKDRLRADIGDLIPDEMLKKMVETSTKEMFFTPTIIKDNYGREVRREPSWFNKAVQDMFQEQVKALVEEYVRDKKEDLTTAAGEIIKNTIPRLLADVVLKMMSNTATDIASNGSITGTQYIADALRSKGFAV